MTLKMRISRLATQVFLYLNALLRFTHIFGAFRPSAARGSLFHVLGVSSVIAAGLVAAARPALALDAILINPDSDRLELTVRGQYYDSRGDRLQVDTAPGRNGLSARIVVSAAAPGTSPNWMVFALTNPTNKTLERWLVASRYTLVGSGVVWPNLDSPRIEAVTPSLGVIPVRVKNDQKDIFSISVPPGKTVTYVVELASAKPTRIYLWKPLSFTEKSRDKQLFNGIMLGIVGLLGIFLVAVFAANHKVIFPSAALVAWCVLAYLCVEFGFWHKLFQLRAADNAVYRAMAEASVASSLVIFLFTFLRLSVWHGFIRLLFGVWIVAQLGLIFTAVIDPQLAATFARLSFVAIGGIGGLLALFLAIRGQDRALALIPTWLLFGVWIFGMAMALLGRLSGDVAVSALIAGLVLLTLLIGFTVTQFAFRASGPNYGAAPNQLQLRSLAIDGAGAAVWEWSAQRDEVKVSPVVEMILGLNHGELSTKLNSFVKHLHPSDRERLRLTLFSAKERAIEDLHIEFRMRHADNSYRWFELVAASVPGADRKALRCVGLMRDITDSKRAQERLTHDAVHDSLTGLPNRELFIDRLGVAIRRSQTEGGAHPTILFIDIDKFKSINSSFGLIVGDSLLLTIARRLARHIGAQDTLARVGGDQFALLVTRAATAGELSKLADDIRQALRAPIAIAGQEIILTVSIGIALYDGDSESEADLLREAEIAMYRAKRTGSDRIEIFEPKMGAEKDERIAIESDLRRALEQNQLKLLYQPIMQLANEELVGFEALVRWEHPKLGLLGPADFVPVAEETDLIVKLGSYVLRVAANEAARWHRELPRPDNPLFVSVNVSSRQLFRPDLIQEYRHIIGQEIVPRGSLRLEITESLVMENPEQALQMLELLKSAGAELSMDDFGTGYSSLAYLQRFPFDTIKVDRALVQGSGEDGPEAVIIRSIVALAHELDMKVIAEGVEIAEDVTYLRSIGCGFAQGFFYGEPMNEREVRKLLRMIHKSERQNRRSGLFSAKSKSRRKAERDGRPNPGQAAVRSGPSPAAGAAAGNAALLARQAAARVQTGTAPAVTADPAVRDGKDSASKPVVGVGQASASPPPAKPPVTASVQAKTAPTKPLSGKQPVPPPPSPPVSQPQQQPTTIPLRSPPPADAPPAVKPPPTATQAKPRSQLQARSPSPASPAATQANGASTASPAAKPSGEPATQPASQSSPNGSLNDDALTDFPTLPPAIAASLARLAGLEVEHDASSGNRAASSGDGAAGKAQDTKPTSAPSAQKEKSQQEQQTAPQKPVGGQKSRAKEPSAPKPPPAPPGNRAAK